MNVISLFTGAGGLDWAFGDKKYNLVLANEILEKHLKTYAYNHSVSFISLENYSNQSNVAVCGDIHHLNLDCGADIVIGGPPCQDFSVLRSDKREGFKVKRGRLYLQYLRILKKTHPKVFVFENVPGMISANSGEAYKAIVSDFKKAGYNMVFNGVLNLSDFGVAQARKRLIIIGALGDFSYLRDKYLKNMTFQKYPMVPIEVFEGKTLNSLQNKYLEIMHDYKDSMRGISNEMSLKWQKEYESLSFDVVVDYLKYNNTSEDDFKKVMKCHRGILKKLGYFKRKLKGRDFKDNSNNISRVNSKTCERMHHISPDYNFRAVLDTPWEVKAMMSNIYRRLHPLKPSLTVIAYGGGGTGGYHYEFERQGLTNRERARLQSFPDNYLFCGNTGDVRAQIGEAVPPLAGYFIEKLVSEILD